MGKEKEEEQKGRGVNKESSYSELVRKPPTLSEERSEINSTKNLTKTQEEVDNDLRYGQVENPVEDKVFEDSGTSNEPSRPTDEDTLDRDLEDIGEL